MPPSDIRAISAIAAASIFNFSLTTTSLSLSINALSLILLKSKRWQRDNIVEGILWGSVVAKIKTICDGGSSSVFNNALKAPVVNICTSSII